MNVGRKKTKRTKKSPKDVSDSEEPDWEPESEEQDDEVIKSESDADHNSILGGDSIGEDDGTGDMELGMGDLEAVKEKEHAGLYENVL